MSGTLRLFKKHLTCKACGHVWDGFLHGFSRGHTVLQNRDRILFIPDDIVYSFASDFDATYPELFFQRGWRDLESCPLCHSKTFEGWRYDQASMAEVPCITIDEHDLLRSEGKWALSEAGTRKIE